MYNKFIEDGREFLKIEDGNINIVFSTAYNDISYKLGEENTQKNIDELKKIFSVNKVNYTKQIHSDILINLDKEESTDSEADGLILSRKNEIAGVFTADCVPVIIYDKDKEVIAAVHSGWKGTIADISKKACELMKKKYSCENIKVVIGPCVGKCCYEVSEELAEKFVNKYGETVADLRMLDLKEAIKIQLKDFVKSEDILDLNLCTNCSTDIELHSYRRKQENSGRLFSFVYIK